MNKKKINVAILLWSINLAYSLHTIRKPPNIVLVIADDLGWNDVGYHGSNQIPTPNIDALAYNGMVLNRFYALSICTPSRAALLTGQYPIRFGCHEFPLLGGENRYLPLDIPLLPEHLKKLGYSTNLIGKWHVGSSYRNTTPTGRGFDYHYGYWQACVGYFNHAFESDTMGGFDIHDNLNPDWSNRNEYVTSLLTRKSQEVIRNHDPNQPLFLMISHLAPHTGKNTYALEVPDVQENDRRFGYIADGNRRKFAGMISELDKSMGVVVKTLKQKGILDDTIIVFISDNGAASSGAHVHSNYGSNWPLRGQKTTLLEGGVRCIGVVYASWLQNKGVINDDLVHITDLLPTLYSAAGGKLEDLGKIDGINQWPNILSKSAEPSRNEMLVNIHTWHNSAAYIGENGRFKLINGATILPMDDAYLGETGRGDSNPMYDISSILESDLNLALGQNLTIQTIIKLRKKLDLGCSQKQDFEQCPYQKTCLFDLLIDPCETTNVASLYPKVIGKLSEKLATYRKLLQPQRDLLVDSEANPVHCNGTWFTWMDRDGCTH